MVLFILKLGEKYASYCQNSRVQVKSNRLYPEIEAELSPPRPMKTRKVASITTPVGKRISFHYFSCKRSLQVKLDQKMRDVEP